LSECCCQFSWSTLWPLLYLVFAAWIHFDGFGIRHRIHLWCGNAVNFFHFIRHTAQCSLLWDMGSRLFMALRGEHTLTDTEFERLLLWRKLTKPVLDKYFEDVKSRILNFCNLQRTWISTLIHFVHWAKQTSLDFGIPWGQGRNFSLSKRILLVVIDPAGIYLDWQKTPSCHYYLYNATLYPLFSDYRRWCSQSWITNWSNGGRKLRLSPSFSTVLPEFQIKYGPTFAESSWFYVLDPDGTLLSGTVARCSYHFQALV
jgi:hypothetical protein